jgi:hypothetical protein
MLKKIVRFTLLLFANATLLAHVAIPHHHHENALVCFFNSNGEESHETCNHKHQTEQNQQNKNNENPSEKCCFIDNVYLPAHNHTTKTTCHVHKKCDCGQTPFTLISNTFDFQDIAETTLFHFRHKPYLVDYLTDYISQTLGLRAPPVC